jgi:hypothetical protein
MPDNFTASPFMFFRAVLDRVPYAQKRSTVVQRLITTNWRLAVGTEAISGRVRISVEFRIDAVREDATRERSCAQPSRAMNVVVQFGAGDERQP